ncbi:hypothetical protein WR25_17711 isoform D [Diploscapter pachys]|uniref:Poly(A) RNA polymerase mitochondrial-like central palm domain-containing protein n=1 Tax=Diploscapter pachys TaxID=2018661 RepID=A0A2A2L9U8_9BILA|nr:hypothetical protein WR25_17711 isoform D [Diploscapter pachys]
MPSTSTKVADKTVKVATKESGEKRSALGWTRFMERMYENHTDKLASLNRKLEDLDAERVRTLDELERRSQFVQFLEKAVINETKCRFVPVGSTVTGLTTSSSDFDYVLFIRDKDRRDEFFSLTNNADHKKSFMKKLRLLIARHAQEMENPITETFSLTQVRVPLLMMKFRDGTSLDVTLPDPTYHAVRNTNLVRCYVQADPRFARLFGWLKNMANAMGIRNSKQGLLSSYHLLTLLIHFLQSEQCLSPWTVLPVLSKTHPFLVSPDIPIDKVIDSLLNPTPPFIKGWSSNNTMDCAELWLRFVDFYDKFDVAKHAIYLSNGIAPRRNQFTDDVKLQIYDPYSNATICRSVNAQRAFKLGIAFLKKNMEDGKICYSLILNNNICDDRV